MHLLLQRDILTPKATLGTLWLAEGWGGGKTLLCYTLEDRVRRGDKVPGETAIPTGKYRIDVRPYGGFAGRYDERFQSIGHNGMLEIADVPGFTDILIHCGNDVDDTSGCLLVGDQATLFENGEHKVFSSSTAYMRIYPQLRPLALDGELFLDVRYSRNLSRGDIRKVEVLS